MLGAGRCPTFNVPTSWMGLPFGSREHKSCIQTLPGPLNQCLPILPGNSLALPTRPGWSSDSTTTIFSQEALERCSCSMGLTAPPQWSARSPVAGPRVRDSPQHFQVPLKPGGIAVRLSNRAESASCPSSLGALSAKSHCCRVGPAFPVASSWRLRQPGPRQEHFVWHLEKVSERVLRFLCPRGGCQTWDTLCGQWGHPAHAGPPGLARMCLPQYTGPQRLSLGHLHLFPFLLTCMDFQMNSFTERCKLACSLGGWWRCYFSVSEGGSWYHSSAARMQQPSFRAQAQKLVPPCLCPSQVPGPALSPVWGGKETWMSSRVENWFNKN